MQLINRRWISQDKFNIIWCTVWILVLFKLEVWGRLCFIVSYSLRVYCWMIFRLYLMYGVTSGLVGTTSPNSRKPLCIGERNWPSTVNCFTKNRERGTRYEWKVVCLNIYCSCLWYSFFLPRAPQQTKVRKIYWEDMSRGKDVFAHSVKPYRAWRYNTNS